MRRLRCLFRRHQWDYVPNENAEKSFDHRMILGDHDRVCRRCGKREEGFYIPEVLHAAHWRRVFNDDLGIDDAMRGREDT